MASSKNIVISYLYTIPWQNTRDVRLLLSANQSERSFQSEFSDKQIHIPFQRRTCFFYAMRDRLWLVSYDECGTNQWEPQLLVTTFVKGLCRGTIPYWNAYVNTDLLFLVILLSVK